MLSFAQFEIASKLYYVVQHSLEIAPIDLFSQLSQTSFFPKIYWAHRDKEEIHIAFGKILDFQSLPTINLISQLEGQPFELRFYGGLSFDKLLEKNSLFTSFGKCYFFLPQFEIIQAQETFTLINTQVFSEKPSHFVLETPKFFNTKLSPLATLKAKHLSHCPEFALWQASLNPLIQDMQHNKFQKVVIARQSTFETQTPTDPFQFLEKLTHSFKNSSFYAFQLTHESAFLGASPEILYTKVHDQIQTEALAGTCSIDTQKNLLNSQKEFDEFNYVSEFLSQRLKKISSQVIKMPDRETHTGYLKHLHSSFKAQLNKNIFHRGIIESLFPSPALCGVPQKKALKMIKNTEQFHRGWYAAPVGWISQNCAELIIAIRSCLISEKKIHLFVGNGITQSSDSIQEWNELNIKMKPFFSILGYES